MALSILCIWTTSTFGQEKLAAEAILKAFKEKERRGSEKNISTSKKEWLSWSRPAQFINSGRKAKMSWKCCSSCSEKVPDFFPRVIFEERGKKNPKIVPFLE